MSNINNYDEVLTSILVNEKSIIGFLSAIFNFLGRRTDFYYVPKGQYENMGFPPGVAEELVVKVLRKCDPKNLKNSDTKASDLNNEIMCSTVAQEVEVEADEDEQHRDSTVDQETPETQNAGPDMNKVNNELSSSQHDHSYSSLGAPPIIPIQNNSDTYNGAEREKYLWSQTIKELDVIVKLPENIKSSKQLKVTINSTDISVVCQNGDIIIKDSVPYKIKTMDSFWNICEGKLCIHIEKIQERWWDKFLNSEEPIDLSKIDCSRPLDDLPEDHVAKVRELQWNQEQKLKGLPTSAEIREMEILKKAWNAPGSPFIGQEFDPSVISQSNMPFSNSEK
ncbi:hypothetical protein ACJJTC_003934 [Scirpophaga incertulas]